MPFVSHLAPLARLRRARFNAVDALSVRLGFLVGGMEIKESLRVSVNSYLIERRTDPGFQPWIAGRDLSPLQEFQRFLRGKMHPCWANLFEIIVVSAISSMISASQLQRLRHLLKAF